MLARRLAARPELDATLSLAGRTTAPMLPPIPYRVGGFGGAEGLAAWLREHRIGALVDATHPFAAQMSRHAAAASLSAGVPLLALTRPPWTPAPGDRWTEVPDAEAAAGALGAAPRRVFLTVGRLSLPAFEAAPQHRYLARTIDRPDPAPRLPHLDLVQERGPFSADRERALMEGWGAQVLVTKNSGGEATRGKLDAARALGLPVIAIARPLRPAVETVHDACAVLDWLERHRAAASPAPRGV